MAAIDLVKMDPRYDDMYLEDGRVNYVVNVEDADIYWRNFAGNEEKWNRAGDRYFSIWLDKFEREAVDRLADDGWNIKTAKPREEGDEERPYIRIKVSFAKRKPQIHLITGTGETMLDENTIDLLDDADIIGCDVSFRPYNWKNEDTGKKGVTAYVDIMYVTIREQAFADKYARMQSPQE